MKYGKEWVHSSRSSTINGCSCVKKGKNWSYYIPKMALDNYIKGGNALDIESIKEVVKIAFKEVIEEMANELVKEKIKKHLI